MSRRSILVTVTYRIVYFISFVIILHFVHFSFSFLIFLYRYILYKSQSVMYACYVMDLNPFMNNTNNNINSKFQLNGEY